MAKRKPSFSIEREKELLEKAKFQEKCCLHWINECETLLKNFDRISKKLDQYDANDYSLDFEKSQKIDALLKEQEALSVKITRHLAKSKIEKDQLDKIDKEVKNFSLFAALLSKKKKKKK